MTAPAPHEARMDIETRTNVNTQNITALAAGQATLTTTVTELATMFKYAEKSRDEDRADIKAVVTELKSMGSVQKDLSELASDVRTLRHGLRNADHALQGIGIVKDKLAESDKRVAEHEARINEIEKWRDKADGATGAVKVVIHLLWALFGSGLVTVVVFVLRMFFVHPGGL